MPKTYTASDAFAPTAEIRAEGAMLKGVLLSSREVETQWGKKPVYRIKVLDADCKFTLDKAEVTPVEGSEVDVFAPTLLNVQLKKVPVGEMITIKYLGRGKKGKGQPPHMFSVVGE